NAPSVRPVPRRWGMSVRIAAASFWRGRSGRWTSERNTRMSEYETAAEHRVRQVPKRASYDRATVHGILDAGYVAHVAFMGEAGPVALPMVYVRDGDAVLIHGSRKSRLMRMIGGGAP